MTRGRPAEEMRAQGFAGDPERARQAGAKGNASRALKGKGGNLVPFTSDSARAAARKSAEVRRAKREERKRDERHLAEIRSTFDRTQLGDDALMSAHAVIRRVHDGEIPVRHAGDAAQWVKVLVDIGRLEKGEATSLQAHITGDLGDLERQIAADMRALGLTDGVIDVEPGGEGPATVVAQGPAAPPPPSPAE